MNSKRSLRKDKNDRTVLHSPPWRDAARTMGNHHEHVPFFFTRFGSPIPLEGFYRDGHAFLIANGPSLKDVDVALLDSRWRMTLNNGVKTVRGNANCTVDDPSRFSLSTWLDPAIIKFMPMAHFEKTLWDNRFMVSPDRAIQNWQPTNLTPGDCPNVVGYRRNEKFHAPRWLDEETINWGNHKKFGGGRSVLLAAVRILYILGFRDVYLLGVDFDMSVKRTYHFAEDRTSAAVRGNRSTFKKLQVWFTELQPLFLKAGYRVWNCNPDSNLTAFPFLSLDDALAASGYAMGDPAQEQTRGMYIKRDDKLKAYEEKNAVLEESGEGESQ